MTLIIWSAKEEIFKCVSPTIKKENSKERKVVLIPGKIMAIIEEEAEADLEAMTEEEAIEVEEEVIEVEEEVVKEAEEDLEVTGEEEEEVIEEEGDLREEMRKEMIIGVIIKRKIMDGENMIIEKGREAKKIMKVAGDCDVILFSIKDNIDFVFLDY
jgi:hypothetical protein